jgi:hypothetical protein
MAIPSPYPSQVDITLPSVRLLHAVYRLRNDLEVTYARSGHLYLSRCRIQIITLRSFVTMYTMGLTGNDDSETRKIPFLSFTS